MFEKDFVSPNLIFGLVQKQDKDFQNGPLVALVALVLMENKMAYKDLNQYPYVHKEKDIQYATENHREKAVD